MTKSPPKSVAVAPDTNGILSSSSADHDQIPPPDGIFKQTNAEIKRVLGLKIPEDGAGFKGVFDIRKNRNVCQNGDSRWEKSTSVQYVDFLAHSGGGVLTFLH